MNADALAGKETSSINEVHSRGRSFILPLLLALCTLFYYFGELANWATWAALRIEFFYGIHDVHRLLFLVPIIYAGYYGRVRGAIIITLVSFIIFLPRAFFISPFPDPLLRMGLFTVIAGVIGSLVGAIRNESARSHRLETLIRSERDRILRILEKMGDGVLITGPDYRVRFINPTMARDFGEGIGTDCYRYLHQSDRPCQACRLSSVIGGVVERWEYSLPDGRTYEVLASPYVDSDGTTCQLATFRDITQKRKG